VFNVQKKDCATIEKLKNDCYTLEEQIKILVRTEIQLRRTKAELFQSKRKIEEYNKTLEQKVEERTKELLVTNEKLRLEMAEREKAENELKKMEEGLKRTERMEAIGLLAGNVAHDLNNLLTSIIGYPSLLLRKLPKDDSMCIPLNAIKKCGEKAAAVVRDLSTLSRKGMISAEPVNLNDIIAMIIKSPEFARLKKEYSGVTINNTIDSSVFTISGSPVYIYNAIMNLIVNAFEAMINGGTLTIFTENVCIDKPINRYELIAAGEYVTATFSDTGIGISEKHLNRIFEPFYSRKVIGRSGTGLGMAILWATVKMHNGFVDIASSEGCGTSITLFFPVSRKIIAEKKEQLILEEHRGNNESVLIVDDADIQRDICTAITSELGYCPISLSSGEEAIAYLKKAKVDLLILDMVMDPGMNGLETYRKITEYHPGQKAIIVSGYSESDLITEAQALGIDVSVKKPYTLEELGRAMRKALDRD
jgi:two-component system, cell cycle sensor histidine kinase and response regulator CckA